MFGLAGVSLAIDPNNPKKCWCCVKAIGGASHVIYTTQADCEKKHGQCYKTEGEANKACLNQLCWCCKDHKVSHIPKSDCLKMGGQCYDSEQQAYQACHPAR